MLIEALDHGAQLGGLTAGQCRDLGGAYPQGQQPDYLPVAAGDGIVDRP